MFPPVTPRVDGASFSLGVRIVSLKVLIAGCLPQDRVQVEGVVRKAVGTRSESGPWCVSLVKLGNSWSISLDGPEPSFKGLSLTATEDRLHETITGALSSPPARGGSKSPQAGGSSPRQNVPGVQPDSPRVAESSPPASTSSGDSRDRYECPKCGRPFLVVYPAEPREQEMKAPVACPHCWELTQVTVSESAAITETYRAEVISG